MKLHKADPVYVRLSRDNDAGIRRFADERGCTVSDAIDIAVDSFLRDERIMARLGELLTARIAAPRREGVGQGG